MIPDIIICLIPWIIIIDITILRIITAICCIYAGPVMIGCSEGGTSIEDLAEKFPDKIIKVSVNRHVNRTD